MTLVSEGFAVGDRVIVLAYRHDFGIDDLRGVVSEVGKFVTVDVDQSPSQRGLGIKSVDVSADRLEREPALRWTRETVLETLNEIAEAEWLEVIRREQAGASKEVIWFHRGRHAALTQAANLLDERVTS